MDNKIMPSLTDKVESALRKFRAVRGDVMLLEEYLAMLDSMDNEQRGMYRETLRSSLNGAECTVKWMEARKIAVDTLDVKREDSAKMQELFEDLLVNMEVWL